MIETKQLTRPELWVVAFDETDYWEDEVVEKWGRFMGYYLVDNARNIHICSFQPNLQAHFLQNQAERHWEEVMEITGEDPVDLQNEEAHQEFIYDHPICYFNTGVIERQKEKGLAELWMGPDHWEWPENAGEIIESYKYRKYDAEEAIEHHYQDRIDEAVQAYSENPIEFPFP